MTVNDDSFFSMLDELLEVEEGLTQWECDFIEDLSRHREEILNFRPSSAQADKLQEIWTKMFG